MKSVSLISKIDSLIPRLLVITIVFYFYKTAFWPLTYLFIASYTIFGILFFIRFKWKFRFSGFLKDFFQPIILFGIYILISIIDNRFTNPVIIKDLLLITVLFSFFYFLYWTNIVLRQKIPKYYVLNLVIYTTLIISVLNLFNMIFANKISSNLHSDLHISIGNTLAGDYNFYCLFILLGLVFLNYRSNDSVIKPRYSIFLTISFSFLYLVNIIISGSRRGIIVLLVLLTVYFIIKITKGIRQFSLKNLFRYSIIILTSLLIFLSLGLILIQNISKKKISIMVNRYASFIGINDLNLINRILWEPKNKIPDSADDIIYTESVQLDPGYLKLLNKNAKLIKTETPYGQGVRVGQQHDTNEELYLYFNKKAIPYLANHSYKISFDARFIQGDINLLKIGWWTDDRNNGNPYTVTSEKKIVPINNNWYNYTTTYTFIDNHFGIVLFLRYDGKDSDFIISNLQITDMDYNATFPKYPYKNVNKEELDIWLNEVNPLDGDDLNLINNGNFKHDFGFWLHSADSLTIKIDTIYGEKCAFIGRGDGNMVNWSLYYGGRNIEFKKNNEYQISFKLKPVFPRTIPFYVGYWVDEGEGYMNNLKLQIDTLNDGWLNIKANYTFKTDQSHLVFPINSQIDNSQFYIKDISLKNLTQPQYQQRPVPALTNMEKALLSARTDKNEKMTSSRKARWHYAAQVWKDEFRWHNKLFGHGFDYLDWYNKKFRDDTSVSDYPHNPFISILLYSGIIGFLLYLWLIYWVLKYYLFYRKGYGLFFIGFLMTFFFSFFSGTHPFDPPIMGFFIVLPFFIHLVNKKEEVLKQHHNEQHAENPDYRS